MISRKIMKAISCKTRMACSSFFIENEIRKFSANDPSAAEFIDLLMLSLVDLSIWLTRLLMSICCGIWKIAPRKKGLKSGVSNCYSPVKGLVTV